MVLNSSHYVSKIVFCLPCYIQCAKSHFIKGVDKGILQKCNENIKLAVKILRSFIANEIFTSWKEFKFFIQLSSHFVSVNEPLFHWESSKALFPNEASLLCDAPRQWNKVENHAGCFIFILVECWLTSFSKLCCCRHESTLFESEINWKILCWACFYVL